MTKSKKKALRKDSKKATMIQQLQEQLGNVTVSCKQTGISRETHYRWTREEKNRNCYTIELDPTFCSHIIERWENYTGKQAVKL